MTYDEAVAHLLSVLNAEMWKEEMNPEALALVLGAVELDNGEWVIPSP